MGVPYWLLSTCGLSPPLFSLYAYHLISPIRLCCLIFTGMNVLQQLSSHMFDT